MLCVPLVLLITAGVRRSFQPLQTFVESADILVWALVGLRWLALRTAGPIIGTPLVELRHALPWTQRTLVFVFGALAASYAGAYILVAHQLGVLEVAYLWFPSSPPSPYDPTFAWLVVCMWILVEMLSIACSLVYAGVCLHLAAKHAQTARLELAKIEGGRGLVHMLREAQPAMHRLSVVLACSCAEFLLYATSFTGQRVECSRPSQHDIGQFACSWVQSYFMAFHTVLFMLTIVVALLLSSVHLRMLHSVSLGVALGKQMSGVQVLRDTLVHLEVLDRRKQLGLRVAGIVVDVHNFFRLLWVLCAALFIFLQYSLSK